MRKNWLCLVLLYSINSELAYSELNKKVQQNESKDVKKVVVPAENQSKPALPSFEHIAEIIRPLLLAIEKDRPDDVLNLFFPEAPFLILKDIKQPDIYYQKLISSYRSDIRKLHKKKVKNLAYVSFKRGGCRWKEVGSEYNKIPYWSCYRNKIYAKSGGDNLVLELHTLINWGDRWYITHLGRSVIIKK